MRRRLGPFASMLVLSTVAFAVQPVGASAQAGDVQQGVLGFYRYPALHGETLVFAAEGDLWKVSTHGGVAERLTTHAAEETNPIISPDGTTLAFTARYEGPAELYTMRLSGGVPVRRTYEAETSVATTWTRGTATTQQTWSQ